MKNQARYLAAACGCVLLTMLAAAPVLAQALPAVIAPAENPVTDDKRVLGKILFWDEQLSSDDTIACGSCHLPSAGGADPRRGVNPGADQIFGTSDDLVGSPGVFRQSASGEKISDPVFGLGKQITGRAAPSNLMAMFADSLFWDGRAQGRFDDPQNSASQVIAVGGALENQAVAPILSDVEMAHVGRTWSQVIAKLQSVTPLALASNIPTDMQAAIAANPSGYSDLFNRAFGDSQITAARIGMAIATYQRTLVPDQTPWDLFQAGNTAAMTPDQIAGWLDFRDESRCSVCHRAPLFTDNQFHNTGLRPASDDIGRQIVTGDAQDSGRFKTPSLRNAGLRSVQMHVGFVTSVSDSVAFYNSETDAGNGIANSHSQFTSDQSRLPGPNGAPYHTVSLFSLDEQRKSRVIDFIANALTDPRVQAQTFPFDRPTLASETNAVPVGLSASEVRASQETSVAAGTVNTVMLRFALQSEDDQTEISVVTLQANGSVDESTSQQPVKLYRDQNGNGMVDDNEPMLASGQFESNDGQLRLQLVQAYLLPQGRSEFLITCDF